MVGYNDACSMPARQVCPAAIAEAPARPLTLNSLAGQNTWDATCRDRESAGWGG